MFRKAVFAMLWERCSALAVGAAGAYFTAQVQVPGLRHPRRVGRDLDRADVCAALDRRAGAGHDRGAAAVGGQRRLAARRRRRHAVEEGRHHRLLRVARPAGDVRGRRALRGPARRRCARRRCDWRRARAASCASRSGCPPTPATRSPRTTRRCRSTSTPSRRTDEQRLRPRSPQLVAVRSAGLRVRAAAAATATPVRVAGGSMAPALHARVTSSSWRCAHRPSAGSIALLRSPATRARAAPGDRRREADGSVRTRGDANPIADFDRDAGDSGRGRGGAASCRSGRLLERWRGSAACATLSAQSNSTRR